MKKFIALFLTLLFSLCGCSNDNIENRFITSDQASPSSQQGKETAVSDETVPSLQSEQAMQNVSSPETTEIASNSQDSSASNAETLGINDFDALLLTLPLTITSTQYVVQDQQYKSLYPDMLQAVIQNNTESDIKNAVVAFVAWDNNNLPVKIKGNIDFTDGAYIKQVNYSDINLVPRGTFGESSGYSIDETCGIASFKAIIVSFETFNGDKWNNPYFAAWSKMYEGVKYDDSLTVDVEIKDTVFEETSSDESISIDDAELSAQIETQSVKVISTQYVVQDEKYKSLYPDMLQAVIKNDSEYDIKNALVAFVAWDKNGLPVKIKGNIDFSDGSYIKEINYNDINLIPGETYGEASGYEIDDSCGIVSFKAIVVSYEAFSGETWSNPIYSDWRKLYEGVKLQ